MATLEALDLRSIRDGETGCLRWLGARNLQGYGQIFMDGRSRPVHRVAYERAYGPIPTGLEIDHVYARGCRHRDCIEPLHLEAVTHRENLRRIVNVNRYNTLKTECPEGHPYTEENTKVELDGRRRCRTCANAQLRAKKSCPDCGLVISGRRMSVHKKLYCAARLTPRIAQDCLSAKRACPECGHPVSRRNMSRHRREQHPTPVPGGVAARKQEAGS